MPFDEDGKWHVHEMPAKYDMEGQLRNTYPKSYPLDNHHELQMQKLRRTFIDAKDNIPDMLPKSIDKFGRMWKHGKIIKEI